MKKRIIITGNIGSGKSTVTKILENEGFKVISADVISSEILEQHQKEVSRLFQIRPMNFVSFKKELSSMVFENIEFKKRLEEFMLPKIYQEIDEISEKYEKEGLLFVAELPTFFETRGLKEYRDLFIINVVADDQLRIQRIMERNNHLSLEEILDRMNSQLNPISKKKFSSVTIDNNLDYNSLKNNVLDIKKTHLL